MTAAADLAARLKGKRSSGGKGWTARCPAHDDRRASLSIAEGEAGALLLHCHAGCTFERILKAAGVEPAKPNGQERSSKSRIVATYDYRDAKGDLLFQVIRMAPKKFWQRRPDGNGDWIKGRGGVETIPYRLPELLNASEIFVCEGEKDCDNLAKLGLVATTNPQGADGDWLEDWGRYFDGRHCILIPDNDDPGRRHVQAVARKLASHAASIRILELPGLPPKGDVSDWISAGGTIAALQQMVAAAPDWEQQAAPEPDGQSGDTGLTEDELALEFTRRHHHELRYVAAWSTWMRWTGTSWRKEITLEAYDLARAVCRDAGAGLNNRKLRALILKGSTRAAVENIARSDRKHAATPEQWDQHPWHLNTPEGILDLQTGIMSPHDPLAYHSKLTAVAPGGDCPLWRAFLARITAKDEDLQSYLQRSAGYALTGLIREHALQFGYGTGANGKSVFLGTLTGVMGEYATVAPMETFTATASDRHPTDLAMLRGARLVTAQETEKGRRWAETKIKALTGGDPISARFMRADFFTFQPQFKLFIAGNHRPGLTEVDEAIRRRMHLVPFNVTIPEEERDPELPEKLKAEWPGILAWMIEGCLAWQEQGLDPPAIVRAASEAYLASEDVFERWRDDCTAPDPNAWESSAELWASWKRWAERAGEGVGTQKTFGQTLEQRGFMPGRQGGTGTRGYRGAQLNRPDYTEDPRYGS
jgi:putative DNA primase/helicase